MRYGRDSMAPRVHPYLDAARLPEPSAPGERVDVRTLVGPPGARIEIEVGPGRGGFAFERLAAAPEVALVGLEIRLKWAKIVDDRLRAQGLGGRARVFAGDARAALATLGPDASVSAVFVHFPDPWWKKRHHKRLVMSPELLDEVARLLAPGGELYVQTDVEERALAYVEQVIAHPAFEPHGDEPGDAHMADNPYGARSPREHRSIADGLPVSRLRFRRRA